MDETTQLPSMLAKLVFQHLDIDTKYEKLLFVEQFTIDSVVCGMEPGIVHIDSFSLIFFAVGKGYIQSVCQAQDIPNHL